MIVKVQACREEVASHFAVHGARLVAVEASKTATLFIAHCAAQNRRSAGAQQHRSAEAQKHCTAQHSTEQHRAAQHNAAQTAQHSVAQSPYGLVQCITEQHSIAQLGAPLVGPVLGTSAAVVARPLCTRSVL